MKLEIVIDDAETRAVWETVQRAKAEVESWPPWKRGEPDASVATDPVGVSQRLCAGSDLER